MHQIYAAMQAEHPLSLWMSDYIPRLEGLHRASLAKRADGSWQLRGFAACARCAWTRRWVGRTSLAPRESRACATCPRGAMYT